VGEQTIGVRLNDAYRMRLDEIRWLLRAGNRSETIRKLIEAEAIRQGMTAMVDAEEETTETDAG